MSMNGNWRLTKDGLRYEYARGRSYANGWRCIEGKYYNFDLRGFVKTGWQKYMGETYYYTSQGKMVTGWADIDGGRYYFQDNGIMKRHQATVDGKRYDFGEDGRMKTGFLVFRCPDGREHLCYAGPDGALAVKEWAYLDGSWYYFGMYGFMTVGLATICGRRFAFDQQGRLQTGWVADGRGGRYYAGEDGGLLRNRSVVTPEGRYYLGKSGHPETGLKRLPEGWVFFLPNGRAATGWLSCAGQKAYAGRDGVLLQGKWLQMGEDRYHFSAVLMDVGMRVIDGERYYFGKDGILQKGWIFVDRRWHYAGESGALKTGWVKDSGNWFYLTQEGLSNDELCYIAEEGGRLTGHYRSRGADGLLQHGYVHAGGQLHYAGLGGTCLTREYIEKDGQQFYRRSQTLVQDGEQTRQMDYLYTEGNNVSMIRYRDQEDDQQLMATWGLPKPSGCS